MARKKTNKATRKNVKKATPVAPVAPVAPVKLDSVQALATYARTFFMKDKRNDGAEFWKTENAPEWLSNLCMDAHESMLPEDWKYGFIVEALDALSSDEHDDPSEARDSLEPDIYNHELHRWLASHLERAGFVDEAVAGYGHSENGIDGDIAMGQLHEMHQVFGSVLSSLEARLSELEDEASS